MQQMMTAIRQLITITDQEFARFSSFCEQRKIRRNTVLSKPGAIPNDIFFIEQGLIRVMITDQEGTEHTIHFALENQFISDYSSFILQMPSVYTLQALEDSSVIVLPRVAIEWGYAHMKEGQKLGRLIAEYYFIYQDNRIKNMYARTPKERYDSITDVFPNIHNRVPQHMIASYLGITPVHLSRLKKSSKSKL